jgi:thiamine pyrophosphate-dependent acetolactate synthase large subunit-like protein
LRFQPASLMSLETPERPVVAFTGDGGLMMGAGGQPLIMPPGIASS